MSCTKLPKSENSPSVTYVGQDTTYTISQNLDKQRFTLWVQTNTGFEKITTADSPIKLYDKINKLEGVK